MLGKKCQENYSIAGDRLAPTFKPNFFPLCLQESKRKDIPQSNLLNNFIADLRSKKAELGQQSIRIHKSFNTIMNPNAKFGIHSLHKLDSKCFLADTIRKNLLIH